ncbi:MAG: SDR family NAD(P)-dependent oxidoreductase, partial [Lentisphaeraceae bacterium]|nr:SDR family NAD(P)-dependent oxidoreductase [Lentisphaeraceae bacterium]
IALLQLDVTDSEAWKEAARFVEREENRLDHIILNAGTCEYIDLPEFDSKSFERVLNINFHGIVKGLEATLPLLRKTSDSHITAVTSSVALLSLPRAEAYGASKAAATYLMNSLRLDLKNSGIKISTVLPGFVETPMTDKNDFPMPFKISSEAAADRILNGIARSKKEIYFPHRFTLPLRLLAALPISMQQIFTRSFVR